MEGFPEEGQAASSSRGYSAVLTLNTAMSRTLRRETRVNPPLTLDGA